MNKRLAILFWALVVVCMGAIFYFSSRTADESAGQSSAILELLIRIFGDNSFTDFIVRKLAHFLEFTGLCVLFNSAFYFTNEKKCVWQSILCTSLYAVTDEVHQIFVIGRSCEVRDWAIDTAGGVTGAIGFLVVFFIIKLIIDKRVKKS